MTRKAGAGGDRSLRHVPGWRLATHLDRLHAKAHLRFVLASLKDNEVNKTVKRATKSGKGGGHAGAARLLLSTR
jgi:hypothetical protein